ncbi:unnamed protein product [Nesidiocoris tenuis]|uniref:Uncharacterized protein n=1 Tax=Nesidiocoris tenuis TaxID=355587 RepID=A0A6H5H317_9HEMI|nr:unnamed protein product [Nesidiocoris tenuis]
MNVDSFGFHRLIQSKELLEETESKSAVKLEVKVYIFKRRRICAGVRRKRQDNPDWPSMLPIRVFLRMQENFHSKRQSRRKTQEMTLLKG